MRSRGSHCSFPAHAPGARKRPLSVLFKKRTRGFAASGSECENPGYSKLASRLQRRGRLLSNDGFESESPLGQMRLLNSFVPSVQSSSAKTMAERPADATAPVRLLLGAASRVRQHARAANRKVATDARNARSNCQVRAACRDLRQQLAELTRAIMHSIVKRNRRPIFEGDHER